MASGGRRLRKRRDGKIGATAMKIIGIDPGVSGAIALLDSAGTLLEVADMPTLRDGAKNRASVNAPLLAEIVYRWHAGAAFVELVGVRPGEGAVGAFSFGRSRGVVDGVLAACGVPATLWPQQLGSAPLASPAPARTPPARKR
jgi:hypothetical protein